MNQYPDFFVDSATFRVELGKEQWVDIKTEMSIGDWEKFDASLIQIEQSPEEDGTSRASRRRGIRGGSSQGQSPTRLKWGSGFVDLLLVNIVLWSFDNVPLNKASISKLKPEWVDQIIDVIEERNPTNPLVRVSQTTSSSDIKPASKEEQPVSPSQPSVT